MNAREQLTSQECDRIEQRIYVEISDELSKANIPQYLDRGPYGEIGFMICANIREAVEILEETPAIWTHKGHSLIITVTHPDR